MNCGIHSRQHVSDVIESQIGQERIDSRQQEVAQGLADLILECSHEAGDEVHDHLVDQS